MTPNELIELMNDKKFKIIHEKIAQLNDVDLALLLSELDDEHLALCFRMIEKRKAADVFAEFDNDLKAELIKSFTKQEIKSIIENMYADDAVDFLEDMPANVVTQLLENVKGDTRATINKLLQYHDDSSGSIMTTEYIELLSTMTVGDALKKIRQTGLNSETVYTCYVTEKRKLLGIVSAKKLLISSDDVNIVDIMNTNYVYTKTSDDKEVVGNLFRKYGLIAIPVIDSEGCIVGIVTFDDAIDVLTAETTEDMQLMAAISKNDEPYLKTSVFNHAKHRILWLLILMFSATITGSIISKYENAIVIIPLLVSFIPMLMDTGGNCGSQSSTLIIRGIAIDEIHFKDFFKVLWKEFRISLLVGFALAAANGARILLQYRDLKLAIVVSCSLMLTIIISKIVGGILPILAKKCHLDPAIMAAPIITTIVDTFSIIIYFAIATMVFAL
ncbi:MAG: magnesium transporter [Clostridia bacterium]